MKKKQKKETRGGSTAPHKVYLLAAALISFTDTATTNQVINTGHEAVNSFCTEVHYYDTLLAALKQKIDPARQRLAEQLKEIKTLTLAATRYKNDELSTVYECLLAEATKRALDSASALAALDGPISAAAATLTAKKAEVQTHKALTAATKASVGNAAPQQHGNAVLTEGTVKSCSSEAEPATTLEIDCSEAAATKTKISALQGLVKDLKDLKVTSQAAIKPPKVTVTVDANNPASQTLKSLQDGRFCIDNSDSGGTTAAAAQKAIAIRDLVLESKPVPVALNIDTTASGDQTTAAKPNHVRLLTTDQELTAAFKAAQSLNAPITKLISEETSETLSSNRGCQAAAAAALEGKLLDSKTKTEINKLALKHLGEEGKNIGEQFFTKLKNDKITIPTTADPITGTTEELAHSGHFQKVLAFFNAKNKMDQGGKPQSLHQKAVKNLRNRSKKKTKMGIIKQPQPNAKPLKRKIVTKQNAIGTQTKNSAKLKRERLLFQL
uniref:Variant surface glycoprotein 1125.1059 n=1 Tax=Trypanosoma brucei TaxID=5691 RepID=A0A1J0R4F7_9TRYP|nr:variant surface glycoprotein 1125.1059 [Trypanosoma brucei]